MKVVNYVQIDFSRNKDITVPSIQYDSGTRWVMVKLYNNGVPIDLHDLKVFIMAVKPDGKEVFNNCNVIDPDDGLIKFEITEQMGFVKGEVECQIKLMDQDRLLSSDIFKLNVNKSLSFENSESTNQLTTLVDALYRVEHLDAELSGEFRDTFNASQLEREESFNDSQMDREEVFNSSQLNREETFNVSETERENIFDNSQVNHEERFNASQAEREDKFNDKLDQFEERFLEIKGEKGDEGDKGDKGDKGEQGPVGPQGPKGDKGDRGLDGRGVELGVYGGQVKWRYAGQAENVGWTSLISLDSLKGAQGPIGLTGPQGPKGDKGDQGEVGPIGPQGEKGEKGDSGVIISDMVDYMGNQHESLKAKNDADVDWLLREINTTHYEGQYITATDSIEGRAKSAILKGNTLLVDELGNEFETPNNPKSTMGTYIDATTGAEISSSTSFNTGFLKSPTVSFIVKGNNRYKRIVFYDENKTFISGVDTQVTDNSDVTITSNKIPSNAFYLRISASINPANANYTPDTKLFIEDINGNNLYSTQLVSVKLPVLKTTGKNLCDNSKNKIAEIDINTGQEVTSGGKTHIVSDYIRVESSNVIGKAYQNGNIAPNATTYRVYDNNKNYLGTDKNAIINGGYIRLRALSSSGSYVSANDIVFQLEYGTQTTSYEPYKSNILSTPNDLVLGSVGDVHDTLDLLTGEVVESTKEIALDGSESDWYYSASNNTFRVPFGDLGISPMNNNKAIYVLADRYNSVSYSSDWNTGSFISMDTAKKVVFRDERFTNLTDWKNELSKNPITVRYQLATESIKTVDLSGQKVYSYDGTTHYICGSEDGSLIPSLSIDVPTNLPALVSRQRATIESQKEQIQTLEVENEILTNEIQRVDEKGEQADLEQLSMTWEIDYRVSELEWFVEDNISSTMTVAETMNLKSGGNTMALSRFEQAKILILAGAYNRETLEKQLTNYLKRGYLTTEEYDELIALMDAKELVSEN